MTRTARGHGSSTGHSTTLKPDVADKILSALRTGVAMDAAAEYAGVPRQTFFDWLKKGRAPRAHRLYRDFAEQVDAALGHFEVHAMARITKAGEEQWQADAWRLERKFPDRYGRRTRIDGNVTVQAVPFVDMSKLTIDEKRQLVTLLEKAQPNQEQLVEGQRPALELLPGTGES